MDEDTGYKKIIVTSDSPTTELIRLSIRVLKEIALRADKNDDLVALTYLITLSSGLDLKSFGNGEN